MGRIAFLRKRLLRYKQTMKGDRKKRRTFALIKLAIAAILMVVAYYRPPYRIHTYHLENADCNCQPIPIPADKPVAATNTAYVEEIINRHPAATRNGNELTIDFAGAEGAWLYFTPTLQYVVDSPEARKRFYARWDSLSKKHIPISGLAPRPDFKTAFRKMSVNGITNITIKGGYDGVTTMPASLYTPYQLANVISDKTINLYTSNFTLGKCKVNNTEFNAGVNNCNVFVAGLNKTKITNTDTLSVTNTELDSCYFQSKYAQWSGVQLKSFAQLEFTREAVLDNLSGSGKLNLVSNAGLSEETQMTINDFRQRYGNVHLNTIYGLSKPAKVVLSNTDISLISFDPEKIRVVVEASEKNKMAGEMFVALLNRFKDNEKERRLYDMDCHQYLKSSNGSFWFRFKEGLWDRWDEYGYNKDNVFQTLWRWLLFFFSINYLFLPYVIRFGYSVSNLYPTYIKTRGNRMTVRLFTDACFSFIYTLFFFLIFKLDLDKLRFNRPMIFAWIIFQFAACFILLFLMGAFHFYER